MTTNKKETYHIPVMLNECLEGLNIRPDGTYVDVTFGGGGHSRAIYERLNEKGKLIAFDQDADALANVWKAPNFYFIPSNFAFLKNQLRALRISGVDGILGDLGVSSHQFNVPERGFSIRSDQPLDMRMNRKSEVSAFDVLKDYDEDELIRIFANYGELKSPRKAAQLICQAREPRALRTTGELMKVLAVMAPKFKENKFFAQVFQAIRIEVNNEMAVLEDFLMQSADVLNPGGRLVVMSYHSLEDRLVKNFMKRGNLDGTIEKDFYGNIIKPFTEIVRKPVTPSPEELEDNPRSRSAKLRIAEKNEGK
ncbi:MAG: 16S rRNA (cytosine(1402)-N(4))-methyltransferase RsmH [Brumimicrobium sp.]|nr:16S rRNA (cytosine(1402)-N(4))-methyltransferase RsmH [Brumimicrobium sp.]